MLHEVSRFSEPDIDNKYFSVIYLITCVYYLDNIVTESSEQSLCVEQTMIISNLSFGKR